MWPMGAAYATVRIRARYCWRIRRTGRKQNRSGKICSLLLANIGKNRFLVLPLPTIKRRTVSPCCLIVISPTVSGQKTDSHPRRAAAKGTAVTEDVRVAGGSPRPGPGTRRSPRPGRAGRAGWLSAAAPAECRHVREIQAQSTSLTNQARQKPVRSCICRAITPSNPPVQARYAGEPSGRRSFSGRVRSVYTGFASRARGPRS
jgi:hypothetical protein